MDAHAFRMAREEGKELPIIDSLSKVTTYAITKIYTNNTASCKWCCIHISWSCKAVECRWYLQWCKPQFKSFNCSDNNLTKDFPNQKKTSREPFRNAKQTSSILFTFNTNAHIPLEMWRNRNEQLKALKLDNKGLKNMSKSKMLRSTILTNIIVILMKH